MRKIIFIFLLALAVYFCFGKSPVTSAEEIKKPAASEEVKGVSEKIPEGKGDLAAVETRLKRYSGFSYGDFTPAQLQDYNELVFRRAAILKRRIFRKYL